MTPIPRMRAEGPRVVVRSLVHEDAGELLRYFDENEQHFAPWEPTRDPEFFTLDHWRRALARHEVDREAGTGTRLCVVTPADPSRIVGLVQVRNVTGAPLFGCVIGYSIDHREQGKGLMTESVGVVVRWLFDELGLHRVEAGYSVQNTRSARVLEKLGFEREGTQRAYLFLDGAWQDHVSTSKVNDDWRPPR